MEINFTLGDREKTEVHLKRNQFTGKFTCSENGVIRILRSPADPETHFSTGNVKYYHFTVGDEEKFDIRIVHSWPERFPALKPQKYEIFVNGVLDKIITSY